MNSMTSNTAPVCAAPTFLDHPMLQRTAHRLELRGIRYSNAADGASGAAAQAAAAAAAPGAPAGGQQQAPAGQQAAPADDAAAQAAHAAEGGDPLEAPVGGVKFSDLPPATQAEVRNLRRSEQTLKADKASLSEQLSKGLTPEQRKEMGKFLGYEKDDTPDVGELTTRAAQAAATAQATARENMVLRAAAGQGANGDQLLDSKAFEKTIEGLDPTDRPGIEAAIKSWITSHPTYASAPAAAASSGSSPAGGEQRSTTKKSLADSVAAGLATQKPKA